MKTLAEQVLERMQPEQDEADTPAQKRMREIAAKLHTSSKMLKVEYNETSGNIEIKFNGGSLVLKSDGRWT